MTDEIKVEGSIVEWAKTEYSKVVEEYGHSGANHRTFRSSADRQFLNEDTNVHVNSEFSKMDYYYFRPGEAVRKQPKLVIKMSMDAYNNVGIIKNTIDLMGDFAVKGFKIVHKNKSVQKFLRKWHKMVNGDHVSERIANTLYRAGNVFVEQINGKIKPETEERWKSVGFIDQPIKSREIPKAYVIHNPTAVEKVESQIAGGRPEFFIHVDKNVEKSIYTGFSSTQRFSSTKGLVKLDPSRLYDYYYKKDDWDKWAKPMTYSVMNELMMLDKVQLADMSALDGAISNIRLWNLGSFEHKVYPTRAAINKLRRILSNSTGGGVLNLVWGPELTFKESNTEVHKFLGKEKYEAILTLIYAGLGIPPTMTGSSSQGGFTNNAVSIKTLVERLQYGRDILVDFWEKQLDQVMRAMGFSGAARIVFTHNALSDEAAEKALLIDLVDRDLISAESVAEVFGFNPEIETLKINRESKQRGKTRPHKSSPYHNPLLDHDLKKAAFNTGEYAPSEVGIKLQEKEGEAPNEMAGQRNEETKSREDAGRPFNAKDSEQRTRKFKPRTVGFVDNFIKYHDMHDAISEEINPAYVQSLGKENMRQLTKDEYLTLEKLKFHCMAHMADGAANISEAMSRGNHPKFSAAQKLIQEFELSVGKLSIEDIKQSYIITLSDNEE